MTPATKNLSTINAQNINNKTEVGQIKEKKTKDATFSAWIYAVLFVSVNNKFSFPPIPKAKPGSEAPDVCVRVDCHRNTGGLGRLRQHRYNLTSPSHECLQFAVMCAFRLALLRTSSPPRTICGVFFIYVKASTLHGDYMGIEVCSDNRCL